MIDKEKIKMLKETLKGVIADEKSNKNSTKLSTWTRVKIKNALNKL